MVEAYEDGFGLELDAELVEDALLDFVFDGDDIGRSCAPAVDDSQRVPAGDTQPFLSNNRIWIGGYSLYQTDVSDYDAILSSEGIVHSTETPQPMAHRWDSGWMPIALAALYQDSINLH